ncbi:hypothetical protein GOBAR_DD09186 [Gossypium barbadense]|nr:hypothetical protein GOBAR_DD09186 [Gossypium barbadense]
MVRKVIVEVVDACDLLPKDGQGSFSPFVIADFDGQKKRTSTKYGDLNPVWNGALEFTVSDPDNMDVKELEIVVCNDKRFGNGSGHKNHFLGRVKLHGSQFTRQGQEGPVYFLWGRRVFLVGLEIVPQQQQQPPQTEDTKPTPGLLVEIIY